MDLKIINRKYYWLKVTFFIIAFLFIITICLVVFAVEYKNLTGFLILIEFLSIVVFLHFLGSLAKTFGKSALTWNFFAFFSAPIGLIVAFLMMSYNVSVARRDVRERKEFPK